MYDKGPVRNSAGPFYWESSKVNTAVSFRL